MFSIKTLFLKILQYSPENTCVKYLSTPILKNICVRLLLNWLYEVIFSNFVFGLHSFKTTFFSFYQGYLSQTLAIHRTAGEGRGPTFIPLYHFRPLTNIQTRICNVACEMTITYFNRTACIYQTATQWDLPPYRITIWLTDWLMIQCLFIYLMNWIQGFCYSNLTWEKSGFELASTVTLVLQANYKNNSHFQTRALGKILRMCRLHILFLPFLVNLGFDVHH